MTVIMDWWQDDTMSEVVSVSNGPSPYFDIEGQYSQYTDVITYELWMSYAVAISSSVTTFRGSKTNFTLTYNIITDNCYHDDSSTSEHHPWFWTAIALGGTAVALVAVIVGIIRHFGCKKTSHKPNCVAYFAVPQTPESVPLYPVPMMPNSQQV